MKALGHQTLIELYDCSVDQISQADIVEEAMVRAAKEAGATVVNSTFHQFSPYGVSGVVVIEESHLAVHTWPEYAYAAADFFTCSNTTDSLKACESLKKSFQARDISVSELQRGSRLFLEKNKSLSQEHGSLKVI